MKILNTYISITTLKKILHILLHLMFAVVVAIIIMVMSKVSDLGNAKLTLYHAIGSIVILLGIWRLFCKLRHFEEYNEIEDIEEDDNDDRY